MSKMATKAAGNVFYQKRIAASAWNDRLSGRAGASEITGINQTRLAYIELGTTYPHPDEVMILSDTYNAPELLNHYCSTICPIGRQTVYRVELAALERTTLRLLQSLNDLDMPSITSDLIDIAADGKIDECERSRMVEILEALDEAGNRIDALKLLFKKQFSHGTNRASHTYK